MLFRILFILFFTTPIVTYAQEQFGSNVLNDSYGICSHITRPNVDFKYRERDLYFADSIGMRWVRTDYDFRTLNNNGVYNPTVFDSVIISAKRANIHILGILDRGTTKYAWDDIDGYKRYVSYLVERYKGRVGAWEMMNEIDLIKNVDSVVYKYTKVIKEIYPLIKQIDPDVTVLMSGLAGALNGSLKTIGENGGFDYCDALNIHSYDTPEHNIKIINGVKQLMTRYGIDKPIWITECGMHTVEAPEFSFYNEVLPAAIEKIGIDSKSVNCAVISDFDYGFISVSDDELKRYFKKQYASIAHYTLAQLNEINVNECPILIASSTESFPQKYFEGLQSYLYKGGTIVFSFGLPLYFNYDLKNNKIGKIMGGTLASRLKISTLMWWTDKAKKLHVPEKALWIASADGFHFNLPSKKEYAERFLTDELLQHGDTFTPLVRAGDDNFDGIVTAIYSFKNAGNVIVNTRMDEQHYIDKEAEQAKRIARNHIIAFAHGIEKVFTYHLRAFETSATYSEDNFGIVHHNFSPKPAYNTYNVLTRMLPDGSTHPFLYNEGDVYVASWYNGKKYVLGVWTTTYKQKVRVKSKIDYVLNYSGRRLSKYNLYINNGVTFIVSNKPRQIKKIGNEYIVY